MNTQPLISVIVVFYNMTREAPRTLFTLSAGYQKDIDSSHYEVIAVDAGSDEPLDPLMVYGHGSNFRLLRFEPAPSPASAINKAVLVSKGEIVMICIDGARILSPGILHFTLAAFRAFRNPVVATMAYHLGSAMQNYSMQDGYNQKEEDRLLDSVNWRQDGYELFRIACLAGSSQEGLFRPIGESNCLSVTRGDYDSMGGLNEDFISPGGGLVNLDFYKRAVSLDRALVMLLGEGTFHQFHGGVATNVPMSQHPGKLFHEEYMQIRVISFVKSDREALLLGSVPAQLMPFVAKSVQYVINEDGNGCFH